MMTMSCLNASCPDSCVFKIRLLVSYAIATRQHRLIQQCSNNLILTAPSELWHYCIHQTITIPNSAASSPPPPSPLPLRYITSAFSLSLVALENSILRTSAISFFTSHFFTHSGTGTGVDTPTLTLSDFYLAVFFLVYIGRYVYLHRVLFVDLQHSLYSVCVYTYEAGAEGGGTRGGMYRRLESGERGKKREGNFERCSGDWTEGAAVDESRRDEN
jgi:hypothetical protein